MASFKLPVSDSPRQTQTVVLEGIGYEYELVWNSRDQAWYFRITTTGRNYAMSTKLTVGFDLLLPYKYKPTVPDGALVVMDRERGLGRIGRNNFGIGKRFELWYFSSDDTGSLKGLYLPE